MKIVNDRFLSCYFYYSLSFLFFTFLSYSFANHGKSKAHIHKSLQRYNKESNPNKTQTCHETMVYHILNNLSHRLYREHDYYKKREDKY